MRHSKARLQLNRFTSWRRATLISLARSLLIHQSIKTTIHKAHAVKPLIEKLISLGKDNSLFAKRQAYRILGNHKLVSLLFNDIAPRFTNRIGGYTRIFKLGARRGDNAEVAVLSLTEIKEKEKRPKKIKAETEKKPEPEAIKEERPLEEREKKPKIEAAVKEKPPITKKPGKKFFMGLRNIFKKERDSL
jgi:large subunit ribosomal protein L17